jgi:hypothetical protein
VGDRGDDVAGLLPPMSHNLTVSKIRLQKEDFATIPEKDRVLLILAGHTINTIATWIKLLRLATNPSAEGPHEGAANAIQAQIILRSLLGALVEAYEWLSKRGNQPYIRQKYLDKINTHSRESLVILQKHFGKNNLLYNIRNKSAYHYPQDFDVTQAFKQVPESEDFDWLLGNHPLNQVFLSSEAVVSFCVVGHVGEEPADQAFSRIMDEANFVSEHLIRYLSGLMDAIATEHLANLYAAPEQITVSSGTSFASADLEFFMNFAGAESK